jgi:hypothetical protein
MSEVNICVMGLRGLMLENSTSPDASKYSD